MGLIECVSEADAAPSGVEACARSRSGGDEIRSVNRLGRVDGDVDESDEHTTDETLPLYCRGIPLYDDRSRPDTDPDGFAEPSCIEVIEVSLVTRAVHTMWRAAYGDDDMERLNGAANPA